MSGIRKAKTEKEHSQFKFPAQELCSLSCYSGFIVYFHGNSSTWDSYVEETDPDHTGFFDVFAAALSEEGYYWNLSNTNIHPLENNPALVLGYDPLHPSSGPKDSYWGGTSFDDGVLDYSDGGCTLFFNTDPGKQYYLTLFLQTTKDMDSSSWGTFSNVSVTPVPEPASSVLFLTGAGALALFKKKKRYRGRDTRGK